MQQLPLSIRLRASSVFASYWAGPNAAAVRMLDEMHQASPHPVIYLYGPAGVGKTHLLQAACVRAGERAIAARYLPLRELRFQGPDTLAGCEDLDLLCLDDFGAVAGDANWERAVFNLYREMEERGGKLAIADESPPLALHFHLRDLASRVLAGAVLRLQLLDEVQQVAALRLRAERRGLELPDDTAGYLLRRMPRDMHSLCAFIDELDEASLVAQRRLTVPFVREVLANKGLGNRE